MRRKRSAISFVIVPISMSRSSVNGTRENFRIDRSGPSTALGGMMALMREPSCRRASTQGCELVDAPADPRNDLVDDPQQMTIVLEADRRQFKLPEALDEHLLVRVDENVGNCLVLEQRLDRSKAKDLVEDLLDELDTFLGVQRYTVLDQHLAHDGPDLAPQLVDRNLVDDRQVEKVEETLVEPHFQVRHVAGTSCGAKPHGGLGRGRAIDVSPLACRRCHLRLVRATLNFS